MKTPSIAALLFASMAPALAAQGGSGSQDPFAGLDQALASVNRTFASDQAPLTDADAHALAAKIEALSGIDLSFSAQRSTAKEAVYLNDQDASSILEINLRNGAFLFNAGMDGLRRDEDTPRLPREDRAEEVARRRLRELDLLPGGVNLRVDHIGGIDMAVHRQDGTNESFRKLVTVRFSRVEDEFQVVGPGGRIKVTLGTDGVLRGLVRDWEHYSARNLRHAEKLRAEEIEQLAIQQVAVIAPGAASKTIESAEIVYFEDGFGVKEPAVRVVAELTFVSVRSDGKGTTEIRNPYDFYVPVLRSPKAYYPHLQDRGIPPPSAD